jgi:hypothetical protein
MSQTGGANGGAPDAAVGGGDAGASRDSRPPDDPPPKVVGSCTNLRGVDQFEEITPPASGKGSYGITNVALDPVHPGTVYAATDHAGLWKSTNCGSTWAKVNTGRNGPAMDGGIIWALALDPVDPRVLYASSFNSGAAGSLFKSVDGGVNWDPMWTGEFAQNIEYNALQMVYIDPADHTHVVATIHANCKDPTQTGPRPFNWGCLGETRDSGATWHLIKGPQSGWTEGATPLIFGSGIVYATTQNGVYYTGNGGGTWEKMGVNGSDGSPGIYRAGDGRWYTGSDYGVVSISPDGRTWKTIPGSPVSFGFVGDGKRLFASIRFPNGNPQLYYTAPESDPSKWTPFAAPKLRDGAVVLAYDPDHHLMYSANSGSGLWRMVTQ